ncbi:hypothetical protein EPI10_021104 [Gossypium australe]|uniref:Uncharacterized protein n=1 Tax=Gossypium australe TaxID=47621 RepID=A0A5B6WHT1_9ROSI|nr:hypothetical protein EPI10_021104 [Gossypium australe]
MCDMSSSQSRASSFIEFVTICSVSRIDMRVCYYGLCIGFTTAAEKEKFGRDFCHYSNLCIIKTISWVSEWHHMRLYTIENGELLFAGQS